MRAEEYLTILTEQIRCRMARGAVREEFLCHIEDQKAAFLSEGMEQAEAEEAAVREMGDPVETGNELDRIHRPKMAWGMIALIAVLSIVGYLVQYLLQEKWIAAGGEGGAGPSGSIPYMIAGLAVMIGVCFADYTRIAVHARELLILMFLFFAVGPIFFSVSVNGSMNWIEIPLAGTFTLSYVQFLTVPLYAAVLYRYRGQGYSALLKAVLWMLPSVLIAAGRPNIVFAGVLMLTCLVVLAAAVWKRWFRVARKPVLAGIAVLAAGAPAAAAVFVWFFSSGYQRERLRYILDPAGTGPGYAASAVRDLVSGSRMIGEGGAGNIARFPNMVEFVLSGVAASYGILAAALIVGLILFLFIRFMRISFRQRNQLGMLMGTGCCAVFLIEMLIYIAVNLGAAYLDSYCPFLTSGGTGMMVTYIMLGLLLSIYRYQNTAPERKLSAKLFRTSE